MSWDTAKRIINYLFTNAIRGEKKEIEIGFWGGEPLLEWGLIKEIAKYVYHKSKWTGIKTYFSGTTNGTLLTSEKFNFMEDHNIRFMVSFDGTKESHDRFRVFGNGKGSHHTIMKNLERALEKWPNYRTRMSICADGAGQFYDDVRFLSKIGIKHIMFSPVYESNWNEESWNIWEVECEKVLDYMELQRKKGIPIEIEHFASYTGGDRSHWPCGAGRDYVGFDVDGAIYPCHRFCKFGDSRPWHEKPMVLGHIESSEIDLNLRAQFLNFIPASGCQVKDCFIETPCHGGCYAVNYDLTGNIHTAPAGLCRYVEMQTRISKKYVEKFGLPKARQSKPCICYFEYYCGPVS